MADLQTTTIQTRLQQAVAQAASDTRSDAEQRNRKLALAIVAEETRKAAINQIIYGQTVTRLQRDAERKLDDLIQRKGDHSPATDRLRFAKQVKQEIEAAHAAARTLSQDLGKAQEQFRGTWDSDASKLKLTDRDTMGPKAERQRQIVEIKKLNASLMALESLAKRAAGYVIEAERAAKDDGSQLTLIERVKQQEALIQKDCADLATKSDTLTRRFAGFFANAVVKKCKASSVKKMTAQDFRIVQGLHEEIQAQLKTVERVRVQLEEHERRFEKLIAGLGDIYREMGNLDPATIVKAIRGADVKLNSNRTEAKAVAKLTADLKRKVA
jgi:hypothetical protein